MFDRPPDYDTNQDPVVRNTAGQVRKRLAQYYYEPGREEELRIDLPPGSYVPEISPPLRTAPAPVAAEPDGRHLYGRWAVVATVVAVIGGVAAFWQIRRSPSPVEQFWAPLLKQSEPIVLCVGQDHPYRLTPEWDRWFEEAGGSQPSGASIPATEVTPMWDRYIGINDAQAATRFASLFSAFGKNVELRGGRNTTLADLRRRPVVLIGAFNNDWTLSLTGELRFYFDSEPARKLDLVRDREHPDQQSWAVRSDLQASQIPMDYAIVTRVFNRTTEQAVVVAAGIKGAGTAAAAEFLTNPAYLAKALESAPPDWSRKNVQFVLAARMFSGSAGPATVIATQYW